MVDQEKLAEAGKMLATKSAFIRSAAKVSGKDYATESPPEKATQSEAEGRALSGGSVPPQARTEPAIPSGPVSGEPGRAVPETPSAEPARVSEPSAKPEVVPATQRITINGKEVDVPREHVEQILGKAQTAAPAAPAGFHPLAAAAELRRWAENEASPEELAAFMALMGKGTQPAQAERQTPQPQEDYETAPRQTAPPDYAQLQKQVAELTARETMRVRQAEAAQQERWLDSQLAKYPVFKDEAIRSLGKNAIVGTLTANPRLNPVQVIAEHAAQYQAWVRSVAREEQVASARAPSSPRTVAPPGGSASRGGSPAVPERSGATTAGKLSPADALLSGAIHREVAQAFRTRQRA